MAWYGNQAGPSNIYGRIFSSLITSNPSSAPYPSSVFASAPNLSPAMVSATLGLSSNLTSGGAVTSQTTSTSQLDSSQLDSTNPMPSSSEYDIRNFSRFINFIKQSLLHHLYHFQGGQGSWRLPLQNFKRNLEYACTGKHLCYRTIGGGIGADSSYW